MKWLSVHAPYFYRYLCLSHNFLSQGMTWLLWARNWAFVLTNILSEGDFGKSGFCYDHKPAHVLVTEVGFGPQLSFQQLFLPCYVLK